MSECPNSPEWAYPVAAISPEGFCYWCSRATGQWVTCEYEVLSVPEVQEALKDGIEELRQWREE
jgi:hypothetical protein